MKQQLKLAKPRNKVTAYGTMGQAVMAETLIGSIWMLPWSMMVPQEGDRGGMELTLPEGVAGLLGHGGCRPLWFWRR